MYMFHFFKTKEEAKTFQKEKGYGTLYSNEPRSRTKKDYAIERMMMQDTNWKPDEFYDEHPFVVAWNAKE